MKIAIIGAGYVGLVSGVCFAELGWNVVCIDSNEGRVEQMRSGRSPIWEPRLDEFLLRHGTSGRLTFESKIDTNAGAADLVFIAVGTPMSDDGEADLSQIQAAVDQIAPQLQGYTLVVIKSTVPVGTNAAVEARLRQLRPDADFDVCSNPEFLREGSAIQDFLFPDRVLVGTNAQRAIVLMRQLYQSLEARDVPLLFVSRESAEIAKYAANTFLAMKISFINEIADLCEATGATVGEVAHAIGKDNRIGEKFLCAGPGYGGSCFPKDVAALAFQARLHGSPVTLVEQVEKINDHRKRSMADRIDAAVGGLQGRTVGILGVTFKPNTDDMRDAPSLTILPELIARGASVKAYDPVGMENAQTVLPSVLWMNNAQAVFDCADGVVLLTEWDEFNALSLNEMRQTMRGNVLIDLRNVYSYERVAAAGLRYFPIGSAPSD